MSFGLTSLEYTSLLVTFLFFYSFYYDCTKAKKKFCIAGTGILNATCQKLSPVELDPDML